MRRREFIAGLSGVAAGSTFSAYADDATKTLGLLLGGKPDDQLWQLYLRAFFQQLRSLGWTEGGNLRTEYRWAFGDPDRMRIGARELVAQAPHAILAGTAPTVPFLKHETQTIPIVFVLVIDPVALGYVASLSKPGANVTGFTNFEPSMGSKWLELLKEIAPGTKRVGYMFDPDLDAAFAGILINSIQAASSSMAIEITAAPVRNEQDIDAAMASFSVGGGMIVLPGNFAALQRGPIASLAARHKVPVVYPFDVFAAGGGLMSYGTVAEEEFRSAAKYMDRILNGTKPSDLPVQTPTKFKLVINLKTAKSLGLDVPPTLLARADEVIE